MNALESIRRTIADFEAIHGEGAALREFSALTILTIAFGASLTLLIVAFGADL